MKSNSRFESLQLYRAIAALVVVMHHINGKFSAPHYYGSRVPNFFVWGQLGVDFFFVLSGFIIAMSLVKPKTASDFLINRAVRVYPPFWIVFFITLGVGLVAGARLHSPIALNEGELIRAVLLLPQEPVPVVGVAWTLHHEVLFYAIAGLWIKFPRLALGISVLVLGGSFFAHASQLADFLFSPFHWEFLGGIAAYRWRHLIPATWAGRWAAASAVLILGMCALIGSQDLFLHVMRWPVLMLLFAMLVAASSQLKWTPTSGLAVFAVKLGDSSYTLYLWHISLITPFTKAVFSLLPHLNGLGALAAGILISASVVGIAHLTYVWLEKPLVRAIRRRVTEGRTSAT